MSNMTGSKVTDTYAPSSPVSSKTSATERGTHVQEPKQAKRMTMTSANAQDKYSPARVVELAIVK